LEILVNKQKEGILQEVKELGMIICTVAGKRQPSFDSDV